jgi:hypothetical protein
LRTGGQRNAFASLVPHEAFFAETAENTLACAELRSVGLFAGGRTGGAAFLSFLVLPTLRLFPASEDVGLFVAKTDDGIEDEGVTTDDALRDVVLTPEVDLAALLPVLAEIPVRLGTDEVGVGLLSLSGLASIALEGTGLCAEFFFIVENHPTRAFCDVCVSSDGAVDEEVGTGEMGRGVEIGGSESALSRIRFAEINKFQTFPFGRGENRKDFQRNEEKGKAEKAVQRPHFLCRNRGYKKKKVSTKKENRSKKATFRILGLCSTKVVRDRTN